MPYKRLKKARRGRPKGAVFRTKNRGTHARRQDYPVKCGVCANAATPDNSVKYDGWIIHKGYCLEKYKKGKPARAQDVFHTQEGATFFRLFSDKVDFVCQRGLKKKGSWIFYKQTHKGLFKLETFPSRSACVRAAEKAAYG